jgi:hypothetical protein
MRSGSNGVFAGALLACLGAGAGAAAAQPAQDEAMSEDDGYCDWVEGAASSQSAVLSSPSIFGTFGYLDQTGLTAVPESTGNDLRLTAGLQYSLSNLYQGAVVRARARAECERHRALGELELNTTFRALQARVRVLEKGMAEAQAFLNTASEDFENRQASLQELTATRLRVDGLRALIVETRRLMAESEPTRPPPAGALSNYYVAEAEVEHQEARLRRAEAWDVSVRLGYDRFLEDDTEDSPLFALASVSFNIGALFQGAGNEQAATGRARFVRAGRGGENAAVLRRLRATAQAEQKREKETAALLADLEKQLAELEQLTSITSRRYRETLWFEWVKVKAEHEYLRTHLASLNQILRNESQ